LIIIQNRMLLRYSRYNKKRPNPYCSGLGYVAVTDSHPRQANISLGSKEIISDKYIGISMTFNRFWCSQCKDEFQENEVEKRTVDTMFGDGRRWYCTICGNAIKCYPEIGEKEQQIISQVKQSLAYIQKFGKPESIDKTCQLLLNIGGLYRELGSTKKAMLVLYNVYELAVQNNLPELATYADELYVKLSHMFGGSDHDTVSPQHLFEQCITYYKPNN